jgi:hypothetical protein
VGPLFLTGSYPACLVENISSKELLNRRSLHCASPDFQCRPVGLMVYMRLSLGRAAHVVVAGSAKSEIRVRSVEKHSQERTAGPQISPLRSFGAPVEMTKGRAALPLSVVADALLRSFVEMTKGGLRFH